MSQAGVVTRLAVRELWITFRLLVLLTGFVGAGALVALLPAPLPDVMQRLAIGVGTATVLAGAIAGWSLAEERQRGRAAWLVGRSVSRGTLLGSWFVAMSLICLTGATVAALLGWLTASGVSLRLDPGSFAAAIVAVAATILAAIAFGLLVGALMRPRLAAIITSVLLAGLGALAWLLRDITGLVPGAALVRLAELREGATMEVAALVAAGVSLLVAALLLAAARLVIERTDL